MPRCLPTALLVFGVTLAARVAFSAEEDPVSFRTEVAPILLSKCAGCHGRKKSSGNYRVDTYQRLVSSPDEAASVVAGKPAESELFRRLITTDDDERMPRKANALPAEEVAILRRWILEGARFDGSDPRASLARIVPRRERPAPPEVYPFAVPIVAVAFAKAGRELLTSGQHELLVWDLETALLVRRIAGMPERVHSLARAPDGNLLAVAGGAPGREGEVVLIDPVGRDVLVSAIVSSDVVLDAAFAPGSGHLAVATADNTLALYAVGPELALLKTFHFSDWVTAVSWNADGTRLLASSRDGTAKVFDAKELTPLATFQGHEGAVYGVAFHPNGESAYSSGADHTIRLWDGRSGKRLQQKTADGKSVDRLLRYDGEVFKLLVAAPYLFGPSSDRTTRQFHVDDGREVRRLARHADWVLCVAYDTASRTLATGSASGRVCIWDEASGTFLCSFLAAPGRRDRRLRL